MFPSNFRFNTVHTFGSDGDVSDHFLINYIKIVEDYFIQQASKDSKDKKIKPKQNKNNWSRSR